MTSIRLLLNIDRLFYPVYLFFQVVNRSLRKNKTPYIQHDYVIIKMMGIGSITRIISTLKKQDIDLNRVHFITLSMNKELCEILEIPKVFYVDSKKTHKTIRDLLKAFSFIRALKPRYIIDYERSSNILGVFRSLVTMFSNTGTVSFYQTPKTRQSGLDIQFSLHEKSIYQLIFLSLSYLPMAVKATEKNATEQSQSENILININASDYLPLRKYPKHDFAVVISGIIKNYPDIGIYLIGSPEEKTYVQSIIDQYFSAHINIVNCCGEWSLKRLVKEFETTQLLITNDSGPMHLAVMKNVPTLVIWGPTTPDTFGYTNQPNVVNIHSHRACAPCFTYPKSKAGITCNGRVDCMKDIAPEVVIEAALELLTTNKNMSWV